MKTPFLAAGSVAIAVLAGGVAFAQTQETTMFAGLNWKFGAASSGLAARVGVIYTDTDASNNVTGARFFFDHGISDGTNRLALTGFSGDTDAVAEIGLGYQFGSGMYAQVGAMGDYWEFGGTYGFTDQGLNGYIGAQSYAFGD